jgi:sulfoxide reductase catalytic subunit YedY
MSKVPHIPSSEITPEHVYRMRRRLMIGIGAAALGTALGACGSAAGTSMPAGTPAPTSAPGATKMDADELGDPLTSFEAVTGYNNFYEFTTDKEGVAPRAQGMRTKPWTVEVAGLVAKPQTFGVEDLIKRFPPEERIYRLRCVEGWSMVIPWLGFPLKKLLDAVEPSAQARYVRLTTLMDSEQFPGQRDSYFSWPYVEGLRLDEAMNDLAILGTGLYGKELLPQNGAPIRLVVPWKYGFKSVKSIVKI